MKKPGYFYKFLVLRSMYFLKFGLKQIMLQRKELQKHSFCLRDLS